MGLHTTGAGRMTMDFLEKQEITTIKWPGNSPDLDPIENLWHIMKWKLEEEEVRSVPQMIEKIKDIWCTEITPQYCSKLATSMPERLMAVLAANGGPTKY